MEQPMLWEPLRAALKHSLSATTSLTSPEFPADSFAINDEGERDRSGEGGARFRRLIEGILFSRKFIITYNLVLVGVLVVVAVGHWGKRITKRTRRRRIRIDSKIDPATDQAGNINTSAITGWDADEGSPLLRRDHAQGSPQKGSTSALMHSWLTYQPKPIPFFNKVLPSNGASLAVLALTGLNVFYVVYNVPFEIPMLFIFADRVGLVFVANLPLLYLFSAKNQPLKWLTGYSYESLNIVHRRLGEILCTLAAVHALGMVGVWYTILRSDKFTFSTFMFSKIILLGLGALVAYEVLYFTSLGSFRQKWYELFLGLHILLQVSALILVWFHHTGSRPYIGIALGIFLVDRLMFRLAIKSTTRQGKLEIMEDGETVKLSSIVSLNVRKGILGNTQWGVGSGWNPTDHVFVSVPAISWNNILQAHPFTIASQAPSSVAAEAKLDLVIRAHDGFSKKLLEHAEKGKPVHVRFDGPYGSHSALEMLHDSDVAVLVAGGSGVAVTWPMVWSLVREFGRLSDSETLEACPLRRRRILFVWVVHQASHLSWLGHQNLADLRASGVDVNLPGPTAKVGRPNVDHIIRDWIENPEDSELLPLRKSKIGLLCSGPDGMNRTVQNLCSSLIREGRDASVEVEKYGW
ncbi:MAG: hypothetical protein M1837_005976 [Sclerophora amabilis]|nr:MAG: hypothetical protein M1837_005976 [Sclerophora amabilis]